MRLVRYFSYLLGVVVCTLENRPLNQPITAPLIPDKYNEIQNIIIFNIRKLKNAYKVFVH